MLLGGPHVEQQPSTTSLEPVGLAGHHWARAPPHEPVLKPGATNRFYWASRTGSCSNHDLCSYPKACFVLVVPEPPPPPKKRDMLVLSPEDMQEAKKSIKEK